METLNPYTSLTVETLDQAENAARANHGDKVSAAVRALARLVRYHEDDDWREEHDHDSRTDDSLLRSMLRDAETALSALAQEAPRPIIGYSSAEAGAYLCRACGQHGHAEGLKVVRQGEALAACTQCGALLVHRSANFGRW